MLSLPSVTLLGIDCVNINRLIKVAELCQQEISFSSCKLLSSIPSTHPSVVYIKHIGSIEEYSQFVMKELANFVDTSHVLLIQYDGFILNPTAWTKEFLEYDYIGAPWWYADGKDVGNGGFSLRSKKLLDFLSNDTRITLTNPEDFHIGRTYRPLLEQQGIRFAPEELAKKFSIEGISKNKQPHSNNVWTCEFGFHGLWKTDISTWLKEHPEFQELDNTLAPRFIRQDPQ